MTGLKDNGGHNHDVGTHPLVFPADAALAFSGDTDPAPLIVVGQTRMAEARIDHPLPEVAGVIETFLVMNTPPGWICVTSCFSPRQWHFRYTLDVGVRNLEPFPDEGVSYKTIRRPRDIERHPKGSYGTSATLRRLQSIVDYYFDITAGQRLSLNDISLPKGGLFDFESPWAPPHKSHREGLAVDINTVNVNGISTACDIALPEGQRFNFDVMLAIALANRPVPNVAAPPGVAVAQCHGGHIHIDFPRSR